MANTRPLPGATRAGGFLTGGARYLQPAEVRPVGGVGTAARQFGNGWWFSALRPTAPLAPAGEAPRRYEYTPGHNLIWTPREGAGLSFASLRQLSYMLDVLRVVIEEAKSGLRSLEWEIRAKRLPGETDRDLGRRSAKDPTARKLRQFFERPDGEQSWDAWLNTFIEDMLVIDAPSILLERDRQNRIGALRLIDGATVTPLVTNEGWTPRPPAPAYYQVVYGAPGWLLTTDDLAYCPFNRVNRGPGELSLYGYPPVEFVVLTINQLLRNEQFSLAFFTEGNMPEAIAGVPAQWTPKQIEELQGWFDSMEKGNLGARRRLRFVPTVQAAGGERMNIVFPKVNPVGFSVQYPELLITIICAAFRISKQTFLKMQNRATARVEKETAQEVGHYGWRRHIENCLNVIIQEKMGEPDYEIAFKHHQETDAVKRMQVNTGYVQTGVMTLNEVRDDLGMVPYAFPEADESLLMTKTGVMSIAAAAAPQPGAAGSGRVAPAADGGATPAAEIPPKEPSGSGPPPAIRPAGKRRVPSIAPDRPSPLNAAAQRQIINAFDRANRKYLGALVAALKPHAEAAEKADKPERKDKGDLLWLDALLLSLGNPYETELPAFEQALTDSASAGVAEAGADTEMSPLEQQHLYVSAADWARARGAQLVRQIGETTQTRVRQTIANALENETKWPDLVEQLQNDGAFSPQRAELIAYTETGNAMVRAAVETWKNAGIVQFVRWETAEDDKVCPICAMNNGVVRRLGDPFPSGDTQPLAHPACRCLLSASDEAGGLPTLAPAAGTGIAKSAGKGKLYIMRHGATLLNQQDRIRGWSGIPLNPAGRAHVAATARRLEGAGIQKIITSNIRRARESANLAGHILGVPVQVDPRLNAWNTGKLTGEKRDASGLDEYISDPDKAPPGGESLNELRARAMAAIKDAQKQASDCGPILVVTHNSVLMAIRDQVRGHDPEPGEPDPAPPGAAVVLVGGKMRPLPEKKPQ